MLKIALLVLLTMVAALSVVGAPEDKVVFLDVGQGDAILLQDGTRQVLIDGGPGMTVLTRLGEEMPWFDRRIEVLVLTHPQRDHMEGLLHVLERYEVGMVLLPRAVNTSQMQAEWLKRIIALDIPYRFAWAGQRLTVGDMRIQILNPLDTDASQAAIKSDVNNASVVTRVDFCGDDLLPPPGKSLSGPPRGCLSFLLTGDAEKRVETMLVNNTAPEIIRADILKVGHHGSNSSTTEQFLWAVSPSAAVISVGADNKFGHPKKEVLERLDGIPIWRTDKRGTIQFTYLNSQWLVK